MFNVGKTIVDSNFDRALKKKYREKKLGTPNNTPNPIFFMFGWNRCFFLKKENINPNTPANVNIKAKYNVE